MENNKLKWAYRHLETGQLGIVITFILGTGFFELLQKIPSKIQSFDSDSANSNNLISYI
jgi:hypothetical protein